MASLEVEMPSFEVEMPSFKVDALLIVLMSFRLECNPSKNEWVSRRRSRDEW